MAGIAISKLSRVLKCSDLKSLYKFAYRLFQIIMVNMLKPLRKVTSFTPSKFYFSLPSPPQSSHYLLSLSLSLSLCIYILIKKSTLTSTLFKDTPTSTWFQLLRDHTLFSCSLSWDMVQLLWFKKETRFLIWGHPKKEYWTCYYYNWIGNNFFIYGVKRELWGWFSSQPKREVWVHHTW